MFSKSTTILKLEIMKLEFYMDIMFMKIEFQKK